MAKRKRGPSTKDGPAEDGSAVKRVAMVQDAHPSTPAWSVQIITGSYERVLHGIVATIPEDAVASSAAGQPASTVFSDSFLFNAHTSAIRCLAVSPSFTDSQKVYLATGSTDERVNLYSLSTVPPRVPSLGKPNGSAGAFISHVKPTASNASNKELGTLNHHSSTITTLAFPTRTKLLTADATNNLAILRTRDWSVLSTLRAPIPKPPNRPSGDTATASDVPAGFNDIAVHPSLKLMLTVGRGERCMRLWNLVTGKKAGVLQFDKELLRQAGEGRYSSGEGRKVRWDADRGAVFAVGFERGVVAFGQDSRPMGVALPKPSTKVHQIRFVKIGDDDVVALSTEDGRVLFYAVTANPSQPGAETLQEREITGLRCLGQLGGRDAGVQSRIKDFQILSLPRDMTGDSKELHLVVTASSDGAIMLWTLNLSELHISPVPESLPLKKNGDSEAEKEIDKGVQYVGSLLSTYETANRITCMEAFILDGKDEDKPETDTLEQAQDSSGESDSDDSDG